MRTVFFVSGVLLAGAVLGQPDPPREWLVVRDTFPGFRGSPDSVVLARDMAPGAGICEHCPGPTGCRYPLAAIDWNGTYQVVLADTADSILCYSRLVRWCEWADPAVITAPQPDPLCPSYNIAAQRNGDDVCLTWVYSPPGLSQKPGFYRISTDGGETWGSPTQLSWPDAYQGDTLPSFHASSLFPYYDPDNYLHIMAGVGPFVSDTNFTLPAQIWHWKDEQWSFVHLADPESLLAPVGFNTLIAGRPSLGNCGDNEDLVSVWEEFDGCNVDTTTGLLRSDIWAAYSSNGGEHWTPAQRLTGPGRRASHRFPSVTDLAIEGTTYDTCLVQCIIDQEAGFACLGQGSATDNPVVVGKFYWWHSPTFDTIGGTTQDLQCLGPAVRTLGNSEDYGVHAAWEYSSDPAGSGFPDLNARYNFYDYATREWNWIDPDPMQSGVGVFFRRTAFGRLAVDPVTDVAIVSGHFAPQVGTADRSFASGSRGPESRLPFFARGTIFVPGAKVRLLDAAGRTVTELGPGENDVSRVAEGVYFVASAGERAVVSKVVIQR